MKARLNNHFRIVFVSLFSMLLVVSCAKHNDRKRLQRSNRPDIKSKHKETTFGDIGSGRTGTTDSKGTPGQTGTQTPSGTGSTQPQTGNSGSKQGTSGDSKAGSTGGNGSSSQGGAEPAKTPEKHVLTKEEKDLREAIAKALDKDDVALLAKWGASGEMADKIHRVLLESVEKDQKVTLKMYVSTVLSQTVERADVQAFTFNTTEWTRGQMPSELEFVPAEKLADDKQKILTSLFNSAKLKVVTVDPKDKYYVLLLGNGSHELAYVFKENEHAFLHLKQILGQEVSTHEKVLAANIYTQSQYPSFVKIQEKSVYINAQVGEILKVINEQKLNQLVSAEMKLLEEETKMVSQLSKKADGALFNSSLYGFVLSVVKIYDLVERYHHFNGNIDSNILKVWQKKLAEATDPSIKQNLQVIVNLTADLAKALSDLSEVDASYEKIAGKKFEIKK